MAIKISGTTVIDDSRNIQNIGVATATTFSGNLTGNVTGNATGLSGTPNLNVGVVTATSFVGNVTGNATGLSGTPNLNVGVVTATGGIQAIGIQSAGTNIATGIITALNFIGTGNTVAVVGNRVDISIAGGGGGATSLDITSNLFF